MNPVDSQRSEVWSRYWSAGVLHSCAGSFAGNYDGEVLAFWRDLLAGLRLPARALDVATGNGPVSKLLAGLTRGRGELEIDAVDLAAVNPAWKAELPQAEAARIRFHAGVAAEALPFAAASFDLVVSQFGIEYSDLARALSEVRRVGTPGARIGLIVHAAESLIIRRGHDELPHYQWLRERGEFWELALRLCRPMALASTPQGRQALAQDVLAAGDRQAFNVHMQALSDRARSESGGELLLDTQQSIAGAFAVCGQSGDAGIGRTRIEALRLALDDSELRLRELVSCARTRGQVEALVEPLGAQLEELRPIRFSNGELLGWGLRARLPG